MEEIEKEFLAAIRNHKGIIVKVAKIYFDHKEDQEDLFQEIIYQLWKSYPSFQGKSKVSSWMYRVALNTAIVYFKKETKQLSQKETIDIAVPADDSQKERVAHLYQAIRQLNKIEKALIFQYIEGVPGEEMAKNLGMSPGNIRVKLNRTKKKLQALIKKQGYEF